MKEPNSSRSGKHETPRVWRSLDELAQTPEFEERLHREFPRQASTWDGSFDRRRFLSLAGASLGLAGLTACSKQPGEKIVPYVLQPEELLPGKPLFFATSRSAGGYAQGVLAESHLGRPTKLEGNPEHPASLGGTDLFTQASIQDLYDPDRSQAVLHLGKIRTWTAFVDELVISLGALEAVGGKGFRILTGTTTSPTFAWLWDEVQAAMPEARWHQFEVAGRDAVRKAAAQAFGEPVEVRYDLTKADVVVAIDSDFLHEGPAAVRYSKDFASRRRVADPEEARTMSRLYSVESTPTGLSTVADHRLPLQSAEVGRFVLALAAQLGVAGVSAPAEATGDVQAWVEELAADLEAHRGASLLVPGEQTDAEIQVLCHAINAHLGNLGTTVLTTDPVAVGPSDQAASFAELVDDMMNGEVDTLLILGVNPVYGATPDQRVTRALKNVRVRVHLGSHLDETSAHCHWHVPEAHYLEAWSDGRAFDGTASIAQPLIEPLYGGKSALEVLAAVAGELTTPADELLQQYWNGEWNGEGTSFDRFWRRALHDGRIEGTAFEPKPVSLQAAAVTSAATAVSAAEAPSLELLFRPDPSLLDGRYANNGWLQECPKPITKLTWDNALLLSPVTARELGFGDPLADANQGKTAPMAQVTVGEASLELPVWVTPGQADGTATLHLGYGRTACGNTGSGVGFDAGVLRTAENPWRVAAQVQPTAGTYPLASTQDHHSMEGRTLVPMAELEDYLHHPDHPYDYHLHVDPDLTMMKPEEFPYDGHAWGMTLDLTSCTGCNACLIACNSENNVPVVGKEQVLLGREMHWIRIDRYFTGEADGVDALVNQPVPCMHCEQAPCEVVCPVAATVHSDEGLNDMVYNRCVGTRYCSNNCPYKVRRFNFLLYQEEVFENPTLQLGTNPDVTVRSRGVMEKCTYCVQRINSARVVAKRENRRIRDGEVVVACQGACPSDAITFGDINDPESQVTKAKASTLDFSLLEELGNRPRTTYLGRIRNPNPQLQQRIDPRGGESHEAHSGGH